MLVLARSRGEKIVIGKPGPEQVVITFVEQHGRFARIGVTAPRDVPIHRAEIYHEIYGEGAYRADKQDC